MTIDWVAEIREARAELAAAEHRFAAAHRAHDPKARHIGRHVLIVRGRIGSLRETLERITDHQGVVG